MPQDSRLRDRSPIARGDAPAGSSELGAKHQNDDGLGQELRLFIDFQRDDGQPVGGFGCSGIGLANDSRPIAVSVSGDRPKGSFCYVGQAVSSTTRVEVELSDRTVADPPLSTATCRSSSGSRLPARARDRPKSALSPLMICSDESPFTNRTLGPEDPQSGARLTG